MSKILIIKPFYVTFEETEKSINYISSRHPDAGLCLLANLFPDDFARIDQEINVEEKILYGPHSKKLTKFQLAKLCFNLRKKKFDKALLLIGRPVYDNYRKGKILLSFSGARQVRLFYPDRNQEAALEPFDVKGPANKFLRMLVFSLKIIFDLIWKSFLLIGVLILFIFFIVLPMKFKKALSR